MSNKDINKQAYEQAEKELLEQQVKKVKGYILETLRTIEQVKEDKTKAEERLRVLKLDLEDLKKGKFDKIEERQEKSKVARGISVVPRTTGHVTLSSSSWGGLVEGTYNTGSGTYYISM